MTDVSQLAFGIRQVDGGAPEQLLPLVYDEWRRLGGGLVIFTAERFASCFTGEMK